MQIAGGVAYPRASPFLPVYLPVDGSTYNGSTYKRIKELDMPMPSAASKPVPKPFSKPDVKSSVPKPAVSKSSAKQPEKKSVRRLKLLITILVAVAAVVALTYQGFLIWMGERLLSVDQPAKADVIVVIPSSDGQPELKAYELYKQGFAPRVLLTGDSLGWNTTAVNLMASHLRNLGLPQSNITSIPPSGRYESAGYCKQICIGRGWRDILVVCPPVESLGIRRLYEKQFPAPFYRLRVVGSLETRFDIESWWTKPEGKEAVLSEYLKLAMGH